MDNTNNDTCACKRCPSCGKLVKDAKDEKVAPPTQPNAVSCWVSGYTQYQQIPLPLVHKMPYPHFYDVQATWAVSR